MEGGREGEKEGKKRGKLGKRRKGRDRGEGRMEGREGGRKQIIIATMAISMEVNFFDNRYVINWDPTRTLGISGSW